MIVICFVTAVGGIVIAACDSLDRLDRLIFLGVSPDSYFGAELL